jgi:hypothetical protein
MCATKYKPTTRSICTLLFTGVLICQALDLTLEWDPTTTCVDGAPLENITGYKLVYGDSSGNYTVTLHVLEGTSKQVTGLENDTTYYFSVQAVTDQTESAYSEELVWTAPAASDLELDIAWDPTTTTVDGTPLENVTGYKLFYSDTSESYRDAVDVPEGTSAKVTNLEYNKTYYFSVKTLTDETESDFSEELSWDAPKMPDTDQDLMSDAWEMANFGSLDATHASLDSDGDGISDLNEFITGTDPNDPSDYEVLSIGESTLSFHAKEPSGDGYENRKRTFSVLYRENLSSGEWTPVPGMENIEATNQMIYLDISDQEQGFYRTQVELN